MESLFWSMFGLTDLNSFEIDKPEFQITRETGVTLFGMFQVLIVIVAINMLIAMMTRSFESIVVRLAVEWYSSKLPLCQTKTLKFSPVSMQSRKKLYPTIICFSLHGKKTLWHCILK